MSSGRGLCVMFLGNNTLSQCPPPLVPAMDCNHIQRVWRYSWLLHAADITGDMVQPDGPLGLYADSKTNDFYANSKQYICTV